jgi:hypothetical protein
LMEFIATPSLHVNADSLSGTTGFVVAPCPRVLWFATGSYGLYQLT